MITIFRNFTLIFLCAAGLAACGQSAPPAKPAAPAAPASAMMAPTMPKEVTDLAGRIALCTHFAGEYGDDPKANGDINKQMDALKCGTAESDEAAMRAKYAGNAAVRKKLDDAKVL